MIYHEFYVQVPQTIRAVAKAVKGVVEFYNKLRTDKELQRQSTGYRTEVRLRDPGAGFNKFLEREAIKTEFNTWESGLRRNDIPLFDYLRMVKGFVELAIDRGLLVKRNKDGRVTKQQQAIFCELMGILGLSFDAQRRVLSSYEGSPWGREALPAGFANGSAFEGEETSDPGLRVPPRLRLHEVRERARQVNRARRGAAPSLSTESDAVLRGTGTHGNAAAIVLPVVSGNPHTALERAGGGGRLQATTSRRALGDQNSTDFDDGVDGLGYGVKRRRIQDAGSLGWVYVFILFFLLNRMFNL